MPTLDKTLNIRIPENLHHTLAMLTKSTGRSKSFLAVEALEQYLSYQSWQLWEVQAGIDEADKGDFATDAEVTTIFQKYAH